MIPTRTDSDFAWIPEKTHPMALLTQYGTDTLNSLSQRYGVSYNAVETLLVAVNNGGGSQAQFSHPELGGMGQWSRGGMTMVGDMFNHNLKALVSNLCGELSNALANGQMFEPVRLRPAAFSSQSQSQGNGSSFMVMGGGYGSQWPEELGQPSSSGSQNNLRYAFFPSTRRLAIDVNGQITVYDTGNHQIGGVSQQQSGDQSLTFTSQYGMVRCADLPVVQMGDQRPSDHGFGAPPAPEPASYVDEGPAQSPAEMYSAEPQKLRTAISSNEIFTMIEQLANLHEKGILNDEEFSTKKAELLARL